MNADYLETLPYDFAEPRTVKADSEDEPLHHMLDFTRIADVFSDPGLTQRISAVVTVGRSETDIVIRPLVFGGDFDQVSMIEEVWWETDVLFVAQYWGADGGELARSLVTPVIVESDKGTRLAPVQGFAYSLAADGTVDFSWEPVEGADSYIVVLQRERRWSVVTEDGAEYDGSSLAIYASMEEGGLIGVEIRHYHVGADWRAQVEAGLEAAAHSGQGAGLEDFAGYTEHDLEAMVQELEEAELSDTMPEVPYPVSGSSEYVQFVAANLIAGNRYLDITRFEDGGIGTPSFEDVLGEAVYQNPYILDHAPRSRTWDRDGKVLAYVSFARTDFDAAEAAPMQERVLAAANRAVAQVISNGMSDRDKALALNKWLIDQAAYDYDALEAINAATTAEEKASIFDSFPNNQNAYGVLVEGKGVCASYAQAYKALADAAGLRAVVVAGVVLESGERHAWNRVFMDGKWQNVDVTWNDGGDPTEYFGVTDASLERAPDWSWMTDTVLRSYAAD